MVDRMHERHYQSHVQSTPAHVQRAPAVTDQVLSTTEFDSGCGNDIRLLCLPSGQCTWEEIKLG